MHRSREEWAARVRNDWVEIPELLAAEDIAELHAQLEAAQAENERLSQCLTYEQHLAGREGTHGPDCHLWGPRHYECLKARVAELADDVEFWKQRYWEGCDRRKIDEPAFQELFSRAEVNAGYSEDDENDAIIGRMFIKQRHALAAAVLRHQLQGGQ